jgi:hypothetical protein
VQFVAFVEVHVRFVALFTMRDVGFAVRVTVGAGVAAAITTKSTVAVAVLTPVQVSV